MKHFLTSFILFLSSIYLAVAQTELNKRSYELVSTRDELVAINAKYNYTTRVEKTNDQYLVLDTESNAYVASITGNLTDYFMEIDTKLETGLIVPIDEETTSPASPLIRRQGGNNHQDPVPCAHRGCVTIAQCGNECVACYPVVCVF